MTPSARRARLVTLASYLPEGKLTNEMIAAERDDWTADKITNKVGITCRNVSAPDEFTSDLAVGAAEALFEKTGVDRKSIDFVVLMTCTPDYLMPITATIVQARLGVPTSAGAIDCTHACTGFTYGLGISAGLVESGRAQRVLLITADRCTTYTADGDASVKTLMGDGATASIVEAAEGPGTPGHALVGRWEYGSDGDGAMHLCVRTSGVKGFEGVETTPTRRPVFEMNAPEIFTFAIGTVAKHVREFVAHCDLTMEDVDLFVFHQSSMMLLNSLRRNLKIPEDRFCIHMAEVGSTSSSAIPLALEAALGDGRAGPGSKVVVTGFGAGLSWGSLLLEFAD